jgi:UDP-glucose 4-epimerase
MESCLVTGGAGFLGAHLVEALVARGLNVHVLDAPPIEGATRLRRVRERIRYFQGSVFDHETLRTASRDVNVLFHLPALGPVAATLEDPLAANRTAAEGTIHVLSIARENSVQRVIYGSDATVYGHGGRLPRSEDSPLEPVSPRGVTLLAGENYCAAFTSNFGLETVRLRAFNIYGPDRLASEPHQGVLEAFAAAVAAGQRPLVFGDGMQTRDFVHIDDVVQAYLLAASNPRISGRAYNIGSGQQTTILGLLGMMGRHVGETVRPMFTRARPGDIRFSLADTSAIQRDLGFCPCTNLAEDLPGLLDGPENILRGPRSPQLRIRAFAGEAVTD